jgi:hypothetical protein
MQLIFPTEGALFGIRYDWKSFLDFKHPHFRVVITDKQVEAMRNKSGTPSEQFDRTIEYLKQTTGLRVESEPTVASEILTQQHELLRGRFDRIMKRKIYAVGEHPIFTNMVREVRNDCERNIVIIKAIAVRLGVDPIALTGTSDRDYVKAAGIPLVETRWYKRSAWPLRPLWKERLRADFIDVLKDLLIAAISILIALALGYIVAPSLPVIADALLLLPTWILALFFILVGVLLYFWRSRAPFTYGCAEVLVGVVGIYAKVPSLNEREALSSWVTLLLAVYIIVRGLDNIEKAPRKPAFLADRWPRIFGTDGTAAGRP